VHLIEYGFLCFLFLKALSNQSVQKQIFLAIIFTTLYGITDEIHQIFVPNRTAQLIDIFTNFLGAVITCVIYQTFVPSKKKL
jgi:VanZ family protein